MKLGIILTGLLLLIFSSMDLHAGKIYKWKDKNGKVHFSDKPPKDQTIKTESKTVEEVNTIVGKPRSGESSQTKPQKDNSQQNAGGLTLAQCKKSVANVKRGIPKFRRTLIKQAKDNPAAASMITEMTKDLESQVTVEDCMASKGKNQESYRCTINSSDIAKCMKGKL